MKIFNYLLVLIASMFGLFFLSSAVCAKEIMLYDQPKADAKSVGKVDLASGIIPIFTPKNSTWLKVADPRNGNVGWIKASDLQNGDSSTVVSFSQKIMTDGKNPHSYQVIQIGQPASTDKITDKQINDMVNQMKMRQEALQLYLKKASDDMINAIKSLYPNDLSSQPATPSKEKATIGKP